MTHFSLGWYDQVPDPKFALELAKEIRLLTKKEVITLFASAEIYEEKFLGLTKPFIADAGWEQ